MVEIIEKKEENIEEKIKISDLYYESYLIHDCEPIDHYDCYYDVEEEEYYFLDLDKYYAWSSITKNRVIMGLILEQLEQLEKKHCNNHIQEKFEKWANEYEYHHGLDMFSELDSDDILDMLKEIIEKEEKGEEEYNDFLKDWRVTDDGK